MPAGPLVLFGAGNMGGAILDGLLEAGPGTPPFVIDPKPRDKIASYADDDVIRLNPSPEPAGQLVIAIKPQLFGTLASALQSWIGPDTLVISIMAGVSLKSLSNTFETGRVIRVMPNTPGAIGEGVSLMSTGTGVTEGDIESAKSLLQPQGQVEGNKK